MANLTLIDSIENLVNDEEVSIFALLNFEKTNDEIINEFQQNDVLKFGNEDEN